MKTLMLLLLGSALAIGGCANQPSLAEHVRIVDEEAKREAAEFEKADKARREAYVQAHPEYREEILKHQIKLGMSQEDVTASWGKPGHVNTSVSAYGTDEQWVYLWAYLYFDNGRLSSWQESQ